MGWIGMGTRMTRVDMCVREGFLERVLVHGNLWIGKIIIYTYERQG